jgi:hypothetical protein
VSFCQALHISILGNKILASAHPVLCICFAPVLEYTGFPVAFDPTSVLLALPLLGCSADHLLFAGVVWLLSPPEIGSKIIFHFHVMAI